MAKNRRRQRAPQPQPVNIPIKEAAKALPFITGSPATADWTKVSYDPNPEPSGDNTNPYLIEATKVREAIKIPLNADIDAVVCVFNQRKEARTRHFTEAGQIDQYIEYREKGKVFKETHINPLAGTKLQEADRQVLEADVQEAEKMVMKLPALLREAWYDGIDGYNDMGYGQDGAAYAPIIGGPLSHQLYLFDFLKMCSHGFWHRNHDPIASRICDIYTDFVVGKGIEFQAASPIVAEWWQKYSDKYKVNERIKSMYSDSLHNGNMLAHFIFDPEDPSNIKMNILDPSTIWEIVTDPADIHNVYYYHQQYPTQYQIFTNPGIPGQKYIIRQIPAAQVLHIKHHAVSNEKWGRSIIFPIFDELKRLKDYYNSKTAKAIIDSNMVLKMMYLMTEEQFNNNATMRENAKKAVSKPMGIVETSVDPATGKPHIDVQIEQSKSGADGASALGTELTIRAGVGVGLPPEFLGVSGAASRATAIERTSPTYKSFEVHQEMVEKILQEWFKRAFKQAQATAQLPRFETKTKRDGTEVMEPLSDKIRFIFPQIISEDRSAYLKDFSTVYADGITSKKTYANHSMAALGVKDYNYDDEMEERKAEGTADAEAQQAQLGSMYPAKDSSRVDTRQQLKR